MLVSMSFVLCEESQWNGVFVCLFVLFPASLHSVLLDPTYLWFTFQLCFFPSLVSASFFLLFSFISCLLFGFVCALKNFTECGNKLVSLRVSPVEKDTCGLSCSALCIQLSVPPFFLFFCPISILIQYFYLVSFWMPWPSFFSVCCQGKKAEPIKRAGTEGDLESNQQQKKKSMKWLIEKENEQEINK